MRGTAPSNKLSANSLCMTCSLQASAPLSPPPPLCPHPCPAATPPTPSGLPDQLFLPRGISFSQRPAVRSITPLVIFFNTETEPMDALSIGHACCLNIDVSGLPVYANGRRRVGYHAERAPGHQVNVVREQAANVEHLALEAFQSLIVRTACPVLTLALARVMWTRGPRPSVYRRGPLFITNHLFLVSCSFGTENTVRSTPSLAKSKA